MSGHKVYVCNKLLAYFPKGVKYRYFKASLMYDPAEDGPEIGLINAFRTFPDGTYKGIYWSRVRNSDS